MPPSSSVCLLCRLNRAPHRNQLPSSAVSSFQRWQQSRSIVQVRRAKPSRMTLSRTVARPPVNSNSKGKNSPHFKNSPFGGMNQTQARIRGRDEPRLRGEDRPRQRGRNEARLRGEDRPRQRGRDEPRLRGNDESRLRETEPSKMRRPSVRSSEVDAVPESLRRARPNQLPVGGINQRSRTKAPSEQRSETRSQRPFDFDKKGQKDSAAPEKSVGSIYKALKMQTSLTPISYTHRNQVKARIQDLEHFEQLGLLTRVSDSIYSQILPDMLDVAPTPIQRVAIPELLKSAARPKIRSAAGDSSKYDQFLLAAETGSGKTLAYLLPIIDSIKRGEVSEKEKGTAVVEKEEDVKKTKMFSLDPPKLSENLNPDIGRPKAIILLPTSELVTQVGGVVKKLAHTVKFRSDMIAANHSSRVIRNRLFRGIDVLTATPHLLASIAESEPNVLSQVEYLVIDEADSLLDRSFSPMTSAIIDRAAPSLKQLILCSATIPRSLDAFLDRRFPSVKRLVTPNLHAIPRRVQLGVVDVDKDPYRGNKDIACADTIWTLGKSAGDQTILGDQFEIRLIIVFVNEREKAVEVANYLKTKGIDAFALNRDTPEQRQSEVLSEFTTPSPRGQTSHVPELIPFEAPSSSSASSSRRLLNTKVLVTTDIASRGIDTLAVRNVILYDVPHSTIDFIHRLGRTGRMGRRGRGVVLVGKKDRKDVVREVREGMFRGQALI